ncbi:MAG: hypothetical protein IJV15_14030 [Lachnospiraceae bacterium]|nr:hypothetical protein [Lachnospiraceae bacterium]
MIDEKKVSLMTKISIFEKKEKNNGLVMSRYFKQDYVRYSALMTIVSATIVYWTIVGAYVFVRFENLLADIDDMDYFGIMYKVLGWYVVFCLVYYILASFVYSYRYEKARKGLTEYNSDLRDLIELTGGPMHHGKLIKNSEIKAVKTEVKDPSEEKKTKKNVVNKTEMINKRQQMEDEERRKQIIENSKRLEAKRAEKKEQENKKMLEIEQAKQQIRERRMALEEEQRKKRMQEYADSMRKGDNK